MSLSQPLPIPRDHWRSRWLHLGNGRIIHRVASIVWDDNPGPNDSWIEGSGKTLCGKTGHLRMPGLFSRMGAPRCKRCCIAMNIPQGDGAPFNANLLEPGDERKS
jgi:hypothetical protein